MGSNTGSEMEASRTNDHIDQAWVCGGCTSPGSEETHLSQPLNRSIQRDYRPCELQTPEVDRIFVLLNTPLSQPALAGLEQLEYEL